MPHLPDALRRRLPGIAWRDRKIAHLSTRVDQLSRSRDELRHRLASARTQLAAEQERSDSELARLQADVEQAGRELDRCQARLELAEQEHARFRRSSFKAKLSSHMAAVNTARASGWHSTSPAVQLPYKLRSYSVAQSHGIAVPAVHRVWERAEDVRLEGGEPGDRVVLKADGGHSGLGVVPLVRTEDGWQTLTGRETLVDGRLGERLLRRISKARGPYFLESFLENATPEVGAGETRLPDDIKIYTAYGEILHVLVMSTAGTRVMDRKGFSRRYFDAEGVPLGEVRPGTPDDGSVSPPDGWQELMEAARRLSAASGLPFVRVDLYATPQGPVLGELTPTPGGRQEYTLDHDLRLGGAWMRAEVRLARDLARGRPHGTLFGDAPYTWWYPESGSQEGRPSPEDPSGWPRVHADPLACFTAPDEVVRTTVRDGSPEQPDAVSSPS